MIPTAFLLFLFRLLALGDSAFIPVQACLMGNQRQMILQQSQQPPEESSEAVTVETTFQRGRQQQLQQQQQQQQQQDQQDSVQTPDNVPIPTTGISVSEVLDEVGQTKFDTTLVPVETLPGVAQIVTTSNNGDLEPVRYLLAATISTTDNSTKLFVMTDVPPYSIALDASIRRHMGPSGKLTAILCTSRTAIHYNDAPAVFTTRRSDLAKWKDAFPQIHIVGYRLDIPRDCAALVTQRLDGYGPWAATENMTFVESGRPLLYKEWDEPTKMGIIEHGATPPDGDAIDDDENYSPDAIRARQLGKAILAIYTPGHTFGTVSYIFPNLQAVVSGYTIPIEVDRDQINAGPTLDVRGYITTSQAGMTKQMESARHLIETYSDRFNVVLPSRADPFFLDGSVQDRRRVLLQIVEQYETIGKVYEQLGIISQNSHDDDNDNDEQ